MITLFNFKIKFAIQLALYTWFQTHTCTSWIISNNLSSTSDVKCQSYKPDAFIYTNLRMKKDKYVIDNHSEVEKKQSTWSQCYLTTKNLFKQECCNFF